jgi:hypothetical protein
MTLLETKMPNPKRVRAAFVTKGGETVDTGFEQTPQIVVCEISTGEVRDVAVLRFEKSALENPPHEPGSGCGGGKPRAGKSSGGCGGAKKKETILNEQEIDLRVAALGHVAVLLTAVTLHAYSALALNRASIFSIKLDEPHHITELVARLQKMLWDPPPWLRKAMSRTAHEAGELIASIQ